MIHWDGPEESCPEAWEACISAAGADSLAEYLERTRSYQKAVEAECGPHEEKKL